MKQADCDNEVHQKKSYLEKDLNNAVFRNCIFESCDFSKAQFLNSKWIDCRFVKCNLSLVKWEGARLQNTQFEECKIVSGNFGLCDRTFLSVGFKKCLIHMANFSDLNLKNISFLASVIRDTHFSHVNLSHYDFRDCDLKASLFHHCDLRGANFLGAVNFSINPLTNQLKNARFSRETAMHLLDYLEIILD